MTAGTSWADAASAEKPRKALIGEAFAADDGDLPPEFPPIGTAQPARHDHASAVTVAFLTSEKAPVSRVERLTWADLSAMLGRVEPGGKTGAAWMPAEIEQGARTAKRVHALSALVLDVEAARRADPQTGVKTVIGTEPPAFEDMVTELDAWGWRAIVHTTHSHHDPAILPADVPHARYRVVLAVSRPLTPAEAPVLGAHVVDVLGLARDAVDGAALRDVARLFFLPRCPADRLGEFRHADVAGEPLDVDRLLTDAARARDALKGASARTRSPKTGGVIDAFNAAHDVGAILEAHGYRRSGRRWLYPHSTTGAPGVRLLPDSSPPRINSGHADDPLADGHAHDAFDVWRILEHGGDQRAAVRAAAELLGIEREAPPVGVDVEALRRSSKARQQGAARADQDGGEPGEPCLNLATGGHGAGDDDGGQRARLPVAPRRPRFALTPAGELLQTPEPLRWLIDDFVLPESHILLFGDPAAGKSLIALDWAASVALGRPWAGREVAQGPVAYIAGEGHFGIRRRLKAWALHNDAEPKLMRAPLVVSNTGARLCDPRSVAELMAALEAFVAEFGALALVVVDTLHRNLGGDEKDEQDIAAMLTVLDEIKLRWRCSTVIVHHSGHGDKDRSRGSSSLRGGIDTEFKVATVGELRTLSCPHKSKDAPKPPPIDFELTVVDLPWMTTKGTPETSVVLTPSRTTGARRPAGRPMPAAVRLGLETFFAAGQGRPVHVEAWREEFYRRSVADTREGKRKAYERVRKEMVVAGALSVTDDVYALSDGAEWCDWSASLLSLGSKFKVAA